MIASADPMPNVRILPREMSQTRSLNSRSYCLVQRSGLISKFGKRARTREGNVNRPADRADKRHHGHGDRGCQGELRCYPTPPNSSILPVGRDIEEVSALACCISVNIILKAVSRVKQPAAEGESGIRGRMNRAACQLDLRAGRWSPPSIAARTDPGSRRTSKSCRNLVDRPGGHDSEGLPQRGGEDCPSDRLPAFCGVGSDAQAHRPKCQE